MSIKIAAIDLDGTLLTKDKKVRDEDLEAINAARKKGVHIVFASGRHFDGVNSTLARTGNTDYCITSAGAIITDSKDMIANTTCLCEKEVSEIFSLLKEKGLYMQSYPPMGKFLYPYRCAHTDIYEAHCSCTGDLYEGLYDAKDQISSKILILDDYEVLKPLQLELQSRFPHLNIVFSQKDHLEIIRGDASKAAALETVCGYYGIDMADALSIGDAEIDLSMIKAAGVSACPANSIDIIKENATFISEKTNDECAVADIINRLILGE